MSKYPLLHHQNSSTYTVVIVAICYIRRPVHGGRLTAKLRLDLLPIAAKKVGEQAEA